jgi:DNA-directed RNA polymerase subunit beta
MRFAEKNNMSIYKHFSNFRPELYPMPNLISIQTDSYHWFLKDGLRELLEEISPIQDATGKLLDLSFSDYHFDEPKYDEIKAKEHNASYEAALRCKLSLLVKKTGEIKEQDIYLGDFPVMTHRGTFIVNGVERVVVSQLIRSPGVFFTSNFYKRRQLFGAKVIPNRGAWLEFETDSAGVIYVRIDRKRKVPATSILRIFGLESDEEIKNAFNDVDVNKDVHYIKNTLEKDVANNKAESFIEVYKRIRPGDLATVDNARQLIEGMFFNFSRYDLSRVGRHKLNQRLGLKTSEEKGRILNKEDLIAIIKEIIKLNNASGSRPDDIDHLGNRRVRSLGELLQNKLRLGIARMERIIKDRMSTLDIDTLTPAQLVNIRPFMATIKEFFTSSQLSQFMDQINPLAELEHKRRLSTLGPGGLMRERAGFEVRDVHPSFYGRICPIQTPEGQNIGLISHLACYTIVNKYGFIETPYARVKNGKITKEIVYLDALEDEKYNIAEASVPYDEDGRLLTQKVAARIKGEPGIVDKNNIDFIDVSPKQSFSVAASLIPFLEHDDANRALMGSNMQRQAVSCVFPQAPLVGTGLEHKAAVDSGQVIVAKEDGVVKEADASHILVENKNSKSIYGKFICYDLLNFERSNQFTCIHHRTRVRKNDLVKKGDVIADGASTDNGDLALGQNVLVAFMPWAGANYEDAIVISEKLVQDDRYSSIHIENFICDVRDTKLGPEVTTPDIPNVGEEKLKDLDEDGIIRIGAEVNPLSILVGKISPKGEADLTSEERLLRAIFGEKARDVKDTSLVLSHGKHGRVVGIRILSRDKGDKLPSGVIKSIQVDVAQLRKIAAGDKLAGRHGNKGVVSKILPIEDMPYLEDGTPVDIILNPLGVASRMNIGQILETHLGLAAKSLNYRSISPVLNGVKEEEIKSELKRAGFDESGKMMLRDGRTGKSFDQPVTVGYIYVMKLHHLVEDKIHMRSIGPYSLITQQPLGGKAQFGGQRFGEMEVWALEGYGAAHTLQEMLTIKSDDVLGRSAAYDSIIRGRSIKNPNIPASFYVLLNELKGLCLNVEVIDRNNNL